MQVFAEGSGRSSPAIVTLTAGLPAPWPSPLPASTSAALTLAAGTVNSPQAHLRAPEEAPPAQTFAEAADAAVAAVEAEAES